MCVLSIKVPIRKKSGNLSYAPRKSFFFFAPCLNIKQFNSTHREDPYQVLPLQVRVNLRAMVMKGCSSFTKAQGLEPHHQIEYAYGEIA